MEEEENRPDGDRERRNGEATGRTGPLDLLEDVVAIFLGCGAWNSGINERVESERGKPPETKTERNI